MGGCPRSRTCCVVFGQNGRERISQVRLKTFGKASMAMSYLASSLNPAAMSDPQALSELI